MPASINNVAVRMVPAANVVVVCFWNVFSIGHGNYCLEFVLLWLVNVNKEHNSCLIASLVKMQMLSMFTICTSKFQNWWVLTNFRRSYMAEILPIRRKTLSNQSINQSQYVYVHSQCTRREGKLLRISILNLFYPFCKEMMRCETCNYAF